MTEADMEEDSFEEGYRSTLDWIKSQIVFGLSSGKPDAPSGDTARRRAWQKGADKADEDLGFAVPWDDEDTSLDPKHIGRMVGEELARKGLPISDADALNPYSGYRLHMEGRAFMEGVAVGINERGLEPEV